MPASQPNHSAPKSIFRRLGRVGLIFLLVLFTLILILILLVQTPYVQDIARQKFQNYLSDKLKTKVVIGKVYIGFPQTLELSNIFIGNRKNDTLIAGAFIKVNINMWKLIHNEVKIQSLQLKEVTLKLKREYPDSSFNFQFINDAFATKSIKPSIQKDTAQLKMSLRILQLEKVRIVFQDAVTGKDLDIWIDHGITKSEVFNPAALTFGVPFVEMQGVIAKLHQFQPRPKSLVNVPKTGAENDNSIHLALQRVLLKDILFDYGDETSLVYTHFQLGSLNGTVKELDLSRRVIDLQELKMDQSILDIRIGKKLVRGIIKKKLNEVITDSISSSWQIRAKMLSVKDNQFQYDDDSNSPLRYGMDYAHLKMEKFSINVNDFLFNKDSITGNITKAKFIEQSGFALTDLKTNFLIAGSQAFFKDLTLITPGTHLQRSILVKYPSIGAVKDKPADINFEVDLQNSKIQLKDILSFVPSLRRNTLFKNPNDTWWVNTRMIGNMDDARIELFQFRGLKDTKIDISGTVRHLTDSKRMGADLRIRDLSGSRRDLLAIVDAKYLPSKISIPEKFQITGIVKGYLNNLLSDIQLNSSLGKAAVKGTIRQLTDSKNAEYNGIVTVENLELGNILQDSLMGAVTGVFEVKGRGFSTEYANASLKGVVHSAIFKGYAYRDFQLDGNIADKYFHANAAIQDPNIHLSMIAEGRISNRYPSLQFTLNIDSIKTLPLHLTSENNFYRGKINADFPNTDPDDLQGNLLVTQSVLVKGGLRVPLDTIKLAAVKTDSGRYVQLTSDAVSVLLSGRYKLTQLESIIDNVIDPYFSTKPLVAEKVDAYDFRLSATVRDRPVLKVFLPDLQQLQPIFLQSRFTSSNGWHASMTAPLIINGTDQVHHLELNADATPSTLNIRATFAQLIRGKGLKMYSTSLIAGISNNKINFFLTSKDQQGKNKYRLGGLLEQPQTGEYLFAIKPDSLKLNYNSWSINGNNKIRISKIGINVNGLELRQQSQQLTINSIGSDLNAPIDVRFLNFKLSTLTAFVRPDSMMLDGILDGQAQVKSLSQQPNFTSDLSLRDVVINKDTLGVVHFKVSSTDSQTFAADVNLSGRGNDVQVTGNYYLTYASNSSSFDFIVDVRNLTLKSLEAVAGPRFVRDASGSLKGKLSVNGDFKNPLVNGDLTFNKTRFNFGLLNSYFSADQARIDFNKDGFRFNNFTIVDSANNKAVLDGTVYTSNFRDYRYDLTLRSRNFHGLNTSKVDNKVYYGQLVFSTNLWIKGTESLPIIDGNIIINEGTKVTAVLPQREPSIETREGIVQFVNFNQLPNDSIFLAQYDSLNRASFSGMDVSVNIEVKKEAELNLIIDEGNGDFLKMKGEGFLNGGIDQSGKVALTGSYELDEGTYELTFNFLKRKFVIQKGSKITWKGEPSNAEVSIVASYIANTAPLDLVDNQLASSSTTVRNIYRQKLPFEVTLRMQGQLLKPLISFDILLPDNKNYNVSKDIIETINEKLILLRQEPSELNKQVFALMLLNRFVGENPFQTTTSGITAESFARASVSKIFTEQLNQLAADLIKGMDINFDVLSQNDDYSTGYRQSRTDLNVALSKRLLSDQLTVTVGSNFELEGAPNTNRQATNIAGNVALDYKLSKDGRYILRVYRKNDYMGVLEGYVIETGIGFIITVDYNRLSDIFLSQKQRQKMRTESRTNIEKNVQQKEPAISKQQ